jgi:WD40 repeat protein
MFRHWDVAAGKEQWKAEGQQKVANRVRFSPDGSLAATGAGTVVALRDAKTGESRRKVETFHKEITALAYAPDGKTIATVAPKGWVGVWDPATGKELLALKGGYVQEGGVVSGGWWSVGYLPDSRGLVTTDQWITGIVWDLTGKRGMKGKSPVTIER